jgi:hypothetical protein
MIEIGTKILEVVWLLFRLIRPGGVQGLIAEVVILRQQLLVLKREKPKCPPLTAVERLIMGFCTHLMTPKRIGNSAIAIAASTLLDFHRALSRAENIPDFFRKRDAQSQARRGLQEN